MKSNETSDLNLDETTHVVKLSFNAYIDTQNIQNILLIDNRTIDSQLFYDSPNEITFPILYSYNSDKGELLNLLRSKFPNGIKRIAFVFHDPINTGISFLNQRLLFDENDLRENQLTFSENVNFLTNLVTEFKVENYDFLACNTLQYSNWTNFYRLLTKITKVTCGASNDKTGNIQYGSNWLMENTNEDIKNIYFNNYINNYAGSLSGTTISQAGGTILFRQNGNTFEYMKSSDGIWIDVANNYPISIENSTPTISSKLSVIFTTNVTFDESLNMNWTSYFVCGSSCITFDGSNNIFTFNIPQYPGLIQNGGVGSYASGLGAVITELGSVGYHTITVKNIKAESNGLNTMYTYLNLSPTGYICQALFGNKIRTIAGYDATLNYIHITNCSNSGKITGKVNNASGGGICGSNLCMYGDAVVSHCSNSGFITIGNYAAGILGPYAGSGLTSNTTVFVSSITVNNCSNTGILGEPQASTGTGAIAGIIGGGFLNNGGIGYVNNCTNTSVIYPQNAGGIIAGDSCRTLSKLFISYCTNSGVISAGGGSGIIANGYGVNSSPSTSTTTMKYCSNSGALVGHGTGGLLPFAVTGHLFNILNCSNSGQISSPGGGGICGQSACGCIINITNCYNTGLMTYCPFAGGICGRNASGDGRLTKLHILNCYNTGDMTGPHLIGCGGICGAQLGFNSHTDSINTISSCYYSGKIFGSNCGGIIGSDFGNATSGGSANIVISNCYTLSDIPSTCGGIIGGTQYNEPSPFNYTYPSIITNLTVNNCFSSGSITDAGSGICSIRAHENVKQALTVTNCYVANSKWNDNIANSYLLYTPKPYSLHGLVWSKNETIDNIPYSLTYFILSNPGNALIGNICFPAGTPITTDQGNIPIEKLDTAFHTIRNKIIVDVTKTVSPDKYLVCFGKDALGNNIPSQKTIISKNHELFYNGKMRKAKEFLPNFKNVTKVKYTGAILYNVLLEKHDKMMVNNLICETLHPNNSVLQVYSALQKLDRADQYLYTGNINDFVIKNNVYGNKTINK